MLRTLPPLAFSKRLTERQTPRFDVLHSMLANESPVLFRTCMIHFLCWLPRGLGFENTSRYALANGYGLCSFHEWERLKT